LAGQAPLRPPRLRRVRVRTRGGRDHLLGRPARVSGRCRWSAVSRSATWRRDVMTLETSRTLFPAPTVAQDVARCCVARIGTPNQRAHYVLSQWCETNVLHQIDPPLKLSFTFERRTKPPTPMDPYLFHEHQHSSTTTCNKILCFPQGFQLRIVSMPSPLANQNCTGVGGGRGDVSFNRLVPSTVSSAKMSCRHVDGTSACIN
jgi:hypothetical protein